MDDFDFKKIAGIVGIVFVIGIIISGFEIVQSGSKGILFNFGAIQNVELDEGLQFKIPLYQVIEEITLRPIQLDYEVEVDSNGAITKDNQTVGADITLYYQYVPGKLVSLWQDIGIERIETILSNTLKESFKSIIGGYDIFQLPISQNEISKEVIQKMKAELSDYPVIISDLKITNYDWSDDFDAQIADTMKKAQQVQQKKQELLITEQEANKQVKEANAKKQAMITLAEGRAKAAELDAQAKELEGLGIKKYNEAVAANWSIELRKLELEIEKERVGKWNGQQVPSQVFTPIPLDLKGTFVK